MNNLCCVSALANKQIMAHLPKDEQSTSWDCDKTEDHLQVPYTVCYILVKDVAVHRADIDHEVARKVLKFTYAPIHCKNSNRFTFSRFNLRL